LDGLQESKAIEEEKMSDYKADLLGDLKDLGYAAKYVSAAVSDSPEAFLVALRDVADSQKGMTKIASEAGVDRVNLYRMLSEDGNPRLTSLLAVLDAIGFRVVLEPVSAGRSGAKHKDRVTERRHKDS
jgi:probable addiction module antidote protein